MTVKQFDNDTFRVSCGPRTMPVYIYRIAIGGGDFSYSVKRGDVSDHAKGETLAKGFASRQAAQRWIEENVA